ncbi:MAG: hypothetical protein JNK23_00565 [Opitutaceae bacterium]|nr:hypothetical protein [Opitutaceae bacterium]
MKFLIAFFAVVGAAIAGDIKLPSGRVLKNAQIGPIVYTTGIPSSLALKYETAVDIKSKKAVTDEVLDIWKSFQVDAEKGKYGSAVVIVVGPASGIPGIATAAEQRNFVFERKDGAWKMTLPSVWSEEKSRTSRNEKAGV